MQDDRLTVCRKHDVDFDRGRSRRFRGLKRRQRIFGVVETVAAVAAEMDVPRFTSQEAEGHYRLDPLVVARVLFTGAS